MAISDPPIPLIDEDVDTQRLSDAVGAFVINDSVLSETGDQPDTEDGPVLSCIEAESIEAEVEDAGATRRRNSRGTHVRKPPLFVNASVKHATALKEGPEIYKMTASKRGYCVIVNNLDFEGDSKKYRKGSKEEGIMLENLFQQLGFEVVQVVDATRDQMKSTFEEYANKQDQIFCDAFIGIILTHGEKDNLVHGSDNRAVEVEQLIDYFNNKNCIALVNKPKIFFVQACRGAKNDHGVAVEFVVDAAGHGDLAAKVDKKILPTWGDTVICYSTVDGFVSSRNEKYGSWFGDALNQVIIEDSCHLELHQLLIKVNNMLMAKEGSNQLKQSLEIVYRGWAKDLYFNPGLEEA